MQRPNATARISVRARAALERLVVATILASTLGLAFTPDRAQAQIALGAQAPDFTKSVLGGGTTSLQAYSGKVVVLFLLGYS